MSGDPYTRKPMDAARTDAEPRNEDAPPAHDPRATRDSRDLREVSAASIDALHAEASAAVSQSADALRSIREQ